MGERKETQTPRKPGSPAHEHWRSLCVGDNLAEMPQGQSYPGLQIQKACSAMSRQSKRGKTSGEAHGRPGGPA